MSACAKSDAHRNRPWPPRAVIRKASGLRTLESALHNSGLGPVAGVDEVGRGACAGPLVIAACVLGPNRLKSLADLDDSKKLTEKSREALYPLIRRYALAFHVVFVPPGEVDRRGVHVANIEGMRRAVAGLPIRPGYVLSDGFRVPGLPMPSLPVIGGGAGAAGVAGGRGGGACRRVGAARTVQGAQVLVHQRAPLGGRVRDAGGATGERVREDTHIATTSRLRSTKRTAA